MGGSDETTAAASTSYMSALTEHPYVSGLGLAALLGFAAYKTGYCCNRATDKKKNGATPAHKPRKGRKRGDGHSRKHRSRKGSRSNDGRRRKRSDSMESDTGHENINPSGNSDRRQRRRQHPRRSTMGAQDSSHLQSGPPNNWGTDGL